MKYYTINQARKMLGVSAQTLRNWDKAGKLKPHHTSANGYRYYAEDDLNSFLGVKIEDAKTIGYCRVDSSKQKEELKKQQEDLRTYLLAQGKPFEIISDIGSGMDYKRKGLQELIKRITNGSIAKIVILHEDKLTIFGFQLIACIAEIYNCEIEIIDTSKQVEQEQVLENLIQIMTACSYKLKGKKASKIKKMIKELTEK